MKYNLPDLTLAERQAQGQLADALKLDMAAQAAQEAAARAYRGDDLTYKAVEKADAHQRRTGLDLRLAKQKHEEAKAALIDAEHERDRLRREHLEKECGEAGYHRRIAPIVEQLRDLDAQLNAKRDALRKALSVHAAGVREAVELGGRVVKKSESDAAWLVSCLVGQDRRVRGDYTPTDDVSRTEKPWDGSLVEHYVTTRHPAQSSQLESRAAEDEAKRYESNTNEKKIQAA